MHSDVGVLSGLAFVLIGFTLIGGPMFLMDWLRKRRETVIACQVALTDALDGRFGPIVAPVVTRPLFGPWEVRIAVPLYRSPMLAPMLAAVEAALVGIDGMDPSSHHIFLNVTSDVQRVASSGSRVGMRVENVAPATSR